MQNKVSNEDTITPNVIERDLFGVGERILKVRTEYLRISRDALAQRLGIGRSTLQHYENGTREPSASSLVAISRLSGVNLAWLLTGDAENESLDLNPASKNEAPDQQFEFIEKKEILSNGEGQMSIATKLFAFRKEWLSSRALSRKNLIIIEMKDDAMEPIISNGDNLLVKVYFAKSEVSADEGTVVTHRIGLERSESIVDGVYLVEIGGHQRVRRVQLDLAGGVYIISDNNAYKALHVDASEFNPSIIKGKVEWVAKSLK